MNHKRDAYTEAHSMYYPIVFSAVHARVDNVDDVLDICQEVFIKFYEKFDEIANHRTWLFGALRISTLEYYRKKNKPEVNMDDVFNDMSLAFVNGFRDLRIVISEALENIENFDDYEEEKALLDLVAIYNFSYREAGKQLGFTKRQVEYRYRRIVERILDSLKRKGITNLEDLL